MITTFQAVFLGVVQGITEFLPISSSGHLAIIQNLFGIKVPLLFDIFLHVGTLLAVLFVLDKKIIKIIKNIRGNRKLIFELLVATAITAFFGFVFRSKIEGLFSNLKLLGIAFLVNGLILFVSRIPTDSPAVKRPLWGDQVMKFRSGIIGLAQSLALIPGISRSGATMASALKTGMRPEEAFEFSFLLYIPAVFGALFLELINQPTHLSQQLLLSGLIGVVVSFGVGVVALNFLKVVLASAKLYYFFPYCIVLGLLIIFLV